MPERETPKTSLKLLRMRDLTAEYGLTPASVYRWIGEGALPRRSRANRAQSQDPRR